MNPWDVSEKLFLSSLALAVSVGGPLSSGDENNSEDVEGNTLEKSLRYGDSGKLVRSIQEKLQEQKVYHRKIDGVFGYHTKLAVKEFQIRSALQVSGMVTPETMKLLYNYTNEETEGKLSLGDKGTDVEILQTRLKELGYYTNNVDGIFGNETLFSVQNFQSKNGLKVDGVVGPLTFSTLNSNDVKINRIEIIPKKNLYSVDSNIITDAKRLIGTPYKWGGTAPSGFDCSGFIKFVFAKKNVILPRTVNEQWNYGYDVKKPSLGDVVFFQTYKPGPSHAGIYIGDNQFIHAGSSSGVSISNLSTSYWKSRYIGAKRMIQY